MTIQVSVLIWTVITFCVLMFCLNRFLFKPLLSLMDAREEKIADARRRHEEGARALAEAQEAAAERRVLAEKQAHAARERALAEAHAAAEAEMHAADGRYAQLLSDRREQAAAEKQQLQQGLAAGMEELVASFVQKLSS